LSPWHALVHMAGSDAAATPVSILGQKRCGACLTRRRGQRRLARVVCHQVVVPAVPVLRVASCTAGHIFRPQGCVLAACAVLHVVPAAGGGRIQLLVCVLRIMHALQRTPFRWPQSMRAPACTAATLAPMGALPPPSPRSPRGRYSRLLGSRSVVSRAAGRVGSGRATGYSLASRLGKQLTRGML
jgi:hypothetical protein